MGYLLWLVLRGQGRAQTFDVRHWIDVITEMFFDYLIVNLAQKAEKIHLVENQKNLQESSKIFENLIFAYFLRLAGRRCGFRARTSSARQSILLIMKIILHTLIAIVILKAAEINRSEVTKKVDTFAPSFPE